MDSNNVTHNKTLKRILSSSAKSSRLTLSLASLGLLLLLVGTFTLPFNQGLFSKLFNKALSHAASASIQITSIAVNNSSVKISFQPVPGAKDYRVYDVTNPMMVKYAGMVHLDTGGNEYFSMQSDNATAVFPFLALQQQVFPPNPALHNHIDVPNTQIEWNMVEDRQPHTLIVEAVDQLGPTPPDNLYQIGNSDPPIPLHQASDTRLGVDEGMTPDGKMSINGQGPSTDNPTVIASSQPFTVQANNSVEAIPSGSDSEQTFFDTFEDSEANTIKLVDQGLGSNPSSNLSFKDYTLNAGSSNVWDLHFQATNNDLSFPFIDGGHFMDVLFDEHPGSSWATMAMVPQKTADLTGGKMLHMTMEVDPEFDYVTRRWVGFDLSPASDPLTNWKEIDFGTNEQPNNSDQAAFINIYRNRVDSNIYTGPTSSTDDSPVKVAADSSYFAPWMASGIEGAAGALDNRARYDLFATTKHVAIFENGSLLTQYDIPNGGLPYSVLSPSFSHYYYHTDAEIPEQSSSYPYQNYFTGVFPYSDERHWDNMGFEVLPASDVPANNDFRSLLSRAQPVLDSKDQCPKNFSCSDIGPVHISGSQHFDGNVMTVRGGNIEQGTNDQGDSFRFVYQPTTSANISARVTSVAQTAWGGQAGGLMVRPSTTWQSPMYLVYVNGTGNGDIFIESRTTQGGSLKNTDSGISGNVPIYLKVTSSGSNFTAVYSSDGSSWKQVPNSSVSLNMGANLLQGIAQMSGNDILGEATFDNVMINNQPLTIPSPTPTSSTTPMPSMSMTPMPSTSPAPNNLLIYDDNTGNLLNGWSDCSSNGEYTHYTMTGMGGMGQYTLHSGTNLGGFLGLCNGSGVNTAGYSALDLYIMDDPGDTGTDVNISFNTMTGQSVTKPIDQFIQGGDTHLVPGKWEHVIVPFSALGLSNSMLTEISFIGTNQTQIVMYMDMLQFTASPSVTPTPSPTPTINPTVTPTITPTSSPSSIPGDLNGDTHVNLTDLSILATNYGLSGASIINPQADINHDGVVNLTDLSLLASHYGT